MCVCVCVFVCVCNVSLYEPSNPLCLLEVDVNINGR